jgi:hypothetical protein
MSKQEELNIAFHITEDDLALNRAGKLSDSQIAQVEAILKQQNRLTLKLTIVLVAGLFIGMIIFGHVPLDIRFIVLPMALFTFFVVEYWRAKGKTYKLGVVQSIVCPLVLLRIMGRKKQFGISINNQVARFMISDVNQVLKEKEWYRFYYVAYQAFNFIVVAEMNFIVAVEVVETKE